MLQLRRDKPPLDGALPQLRQLEYHERGRCSRSAQGGDSCCPAGCCGSSGGRDHPDRPALSEISTTEEKSRILTGISELDRVLGGGIVLGGVVLLSGEPGVGKSTMLLQLCGAISNQHSVLYITGEESVRQVKLRAARLKVPQDNIFLAAENDVDEICGLIEKEKPDLVVIDSIQTMRCMDISSSSGTVSQVKESAARLLAVAKKQEIPMFIVGHVNKDGAIAGPKVMEHIVDTVLYFEGDKMLPYRILRAAKNRYGSTNELGMFDMTGTGLARLKTPPRCCWKDVRWGFPATAWPAPWRVAVLS